MVFCERSPICSTPETNTTLSNNYTTIFKKKKKAAPAEIGRSIGEGDMTVQPPFPRICYLLLVSFDRNPNQMI